MLKKSASRLKQALSPKNTSQKQTPAMAAGQESERAAEQFLREQGLKLIQRNYRCKAGEIDLIMQDREHLVFVEVRFRRNSRYGSASETVNLQKQQKLIRAAQYYLQTCAKHSLPACRFDVIAIQGEPSQTAAAQKKHSETHQKQTANDPLATKGQFSSTNTRQKPIEWIPNAFTL
ncbi:YraN family protein [Pseudomaricurvus sp.]|uniref:YraN family protein n=1 Tax=Pseudomaricurvus sp. TaxID=2004510 RepID=UPI003F6B7420